MELISTAAELHARLSKEPRISFVPTMGNLHAGHLELVRVARAQGGCVVVSIFVNPLQFGPSEDFDQYPRTLEADRDKLQGLADVVFAPAVGEMYPEKQTVFVDPPPIANELCGAFRPGHFRGVATVVLKLFNLVRPHVAVFGKKDYQQLAIIRQMVNQLNLPISILGVETMRAEDGLALSSRNQYLGTAERAEATRLRLTLQEAARRLQAGEKNMEQIQAEAIQHLERHGWKAEYVDIRSQHALAVPSETERNLVILGAAWLGNTRLIDNLEVCLGSQGPI